MHPFIRTTILIVACDHLLFRQDIINLTKTRYLRLHNSVSGKSSTASHLLDHRRRPCHHLLQLQAQTLQQGVFAWKVWIVDE